MQAELTIDHLTFSYGDREVIRDLSLTLPAGTFSLLIGPTGCGKSTLLKIMAGLYPKYGGQLTSGQVSLGGRSQAMMFQEAGEQFTMATPREEIIFAMENLGKSKTEFADWLKLASKFAEIDSLLDQKIVTMSGGEKQRVALAVLVAMDVDLFLLDEPFASVDPAARRFLIGRLAKLKEQGKTIIITARRAYIMQNSITLTRLDTGAELQAHSFGMSLDYQSWTWSWQASLHHTAAAHLGRDTQGDPADLLATINGVPFRLRLERVARDRRHLPQERYSVSGKGRAAILDAPWAPQMQFGNPLAEYTAQQLAVNALTINGVGIGWGVDWQLEDWLVPAGAWALQGSYIAAINDIAQAAGGYVQPHNTDAVLRILHKYPTAPWEWGAVTPDFEIPSALAEVESTEFIDKPIYNRVFVGGQGAGVFGPLTRAATPGDKIAPQATHPLITAAPAWRPRGRAELSDVGKQERIRISLPVLAETGVITPGQFVRYRTGPQQTQTGIVRGTAIDWQRPRLRQTLEIEAHEFV